MLRKFLIFIICFIPWFAATLVPVDYNYYKELILPSFAPPSIFYGIAWSIVYLLISISILCILHSYKIKEINYSYKISLIINYLFNQSYILVSFGLKNNFLGFVSCVFTLGSLLFLMYEVYNLKKSCIKYLIPYLLLSLFAVVLSFSIFILNI